MKNIKNEIDTLASQGAAICVLLGSISPGITLSDDSLSAVALDLHAKFDRINQLINAKEEQP